MGAASIEQAHARILESALLVRSAGRRCCPALLFNTAALLPSFLLSHRRQTLLFSATMPRRVERLAADALVSPVRITAGEAGAANEDVKQARTLLRVERTALL